MSFIRWYLAIGAIIAVAVFLHHQLRNPRDEDRIRDKIDSMNPDSKKWWWRPMNKVLIPSLAVASVILIWPIAIYWKIKNSIDARQDKIREEARVFSVNQQHVLKMLPVEEVESSEIVHDPLGAVPPIPFGHLNAAWKNYKKQIQNGDQLWSFRATWTTEWGAKELWEGYVIEHNNDFGPYFLTITKRVNT